MAPGHERNVVYTYRYLRAAMIALLLLLVLSVGYQWWFESGGTCWLGSISAYYYTPARTIFVGSLCALGACLIAYKGHSAEEDVLLNFSGFMAFVVAMVPTVPDELCGGNAYSQTLPEIASAVRNNVWSLILVTVLSAAIVLVLRRLSASGQTRVRPSKRTIGVAVACSAVLVVELALVLLVRDQFIAISHGLAAVTMVAGIIAVMLFSALRTKERHQAMTGDQQADASLAAGTGREYKTIYFVIAAVLTVALFGTVGVRYFTGFDRFILVVELLVIVLFATYWGVQTRELWSLSRSASTEVAAAGTASGSPSSNGRAVPEPNGTRQGPALESAIEARETESVAE